MGVLFEGALPRGAPRKIPRYKAKSTGYLRQTLMQVMDVAPRLGILALVPTIFNTGLMTGHGDPHLGYTEKNIHNMLHL